MKTSEKGLALIKEFEGFQSKPYKCPAGVPTIGYGSTFYLNGSKVKLTDRAITEKEATDLLVKSLVKYEHTVNVTVKVPLDQNEFDALVSFVYNLGAGNFISSTLLKLINSEAPPAEIAQQFIKWNKCNGEPLAGLTRRREAERDLYLGVH